MSGTKPVLDAPPDSAGAGNRREFTDSRAAVRFDAFLFAAAATVVVTRAFLAASGYPQVGGSKLHIAHVLWGGLLLGVGMTIMMVSLGSAAKFWASLLGGVGFGLFIDEVGKFVTKDVDYFFKPAIAIIYATLITAYMIGRELLSRRTLTPKRVRAIAAIAIADNELGQLTPGRQASVLALLRRYCDDRDGAALAKLLESKHDRPHHSVEDLFASVTTRFHDLFVAAAARRWVRLTVFGVLAVQAVGSVAVEVAVIVDLAIDRHAQVGSVDVAILAGTAVQTALVGIGLVFLLRDHWQVALRAIRMGLFVTLMFTLVMEFTQRQLAALLDFAVVAALFGIVGAAVPAEGRGDLVHGRSRRRPASRD
jgi:hypothetical protein